MRSIIIPQAAIWEVSLLRSIRPRIISSIPLIKTIVLCAGIYGGIIRSYIFGVRK
jgi:hypothetical protein